MDILKQDDYSCTFTSGRVLYPGVGKDEFTFTADDTGKITVPPEGKDIRDLHPDMDAAMAWPHAGHWYDRLDRTWFTLLDMQNWNHPNLIAPSRGLEVEAFTRDGGQNFVGSAEIRFRPYNVESSETIGEMVVIEYDYNGGTPAEMNVNVVETEKATA